MIGERYSDYEGEESGIQRFWILFVIGFSIIIVGIIFLMVASLLSDGSTNFGALIFIGPIPIVLGAGPQATWMILFSIILAVISIIMFLIYRRQI